MYHFSAAREAAAFANDRPRARNVCRPAGKLALLGPRSLRAGPATMVAQRAQKDIGRADKGALGVRAFKCPRRVLPGAASFVRVRVRVRLWPPGDHQLAARRKTTLHLFGRPSTRASERSCERSRCQFGRHLCHQSGGYFFARPLTHRLDGLLYLKEREKKERERKRKRFHELRPLLISFSQVVINMTKAIMSCVCRRRPA